MAKPNMPLALETMQRLVPLLKDNGFTLTLESLTAEALGETHDLPVTELNNLDTSCDCLIVIGGDGIFLQAANQLIAKGIPLVGVNRGRLGFLTDIHPDEIHTKLLDVLTGHYRKETRLMLQSQRADKGQTDALGFALNEFVLYSGAQAQMIEFEVYVDEQFVCHQRADGIILSTPTGSTAYSLSAGGPILRPGLDAIVLVPMFPHTLSLRPLVLPSSSQIEVKLRHDNAHEARISADGSDKGEIAPGQSLIVNKHPNPLHILHPEDYRYFETLRSKLHWGTALTE